MGWVLSLCKDGVGVFYSMRLEKLGLTTLLKRRMGSDLIETFKISYGISNYDRYFFNISPQTGNLLSRQILKTKSIYKLDFFLLIE